jgi:hypothetical protein
MTRAWSGAAPNRVREIASAALEALEAGDAAEACAILLGALEEPDHERRGRYTCPRCPWTGRWPGELADHIHRHADVRDGL